jgi:hypothetical protein
MGEVYEADETKWPKFSKPCHLCCVAGGTRAGRRCFLLEDDVPASESAVRSSLRELAPARQMVFQLGKSLNSLGSAAPLCEVIATYRDPEASEARPLHRGDRRMAILVIHH